MKRKFNFFIILAVLLFTLVSCGFLENKTLHVPKSVIQEKIDKKFPMTRNYLLAKVTVKNPKIDFKDEKMYIETDYQASMLGGENKGKIYLSSDIRYDVGKEELYLVDLYIDRITDENGNEVGNSPQVKAVTSLITNYVEKNPVYKYGEDYDEKNKNKKKKNVKIKNMYIKKGKFYVQT